MDPTKHAGCFEASVWWRVNHFDLKTSEKNTSVADNRNNCIKSYFFHFVYDQKISYHMMISKFKLKYSEKDAFPFLPGILYEAFHKKISIKWLITFRYLKWLTLQARQRLGIVIIDKIKWFFVLTLAHHKATVIIV